MVIIRTFKYTETTITFANIILWCYAVHVLPLVWQTKFHTHTKQQVKLTVRHIDNNSTFYC